MTFLDKARRAAEQARQTATQGLSGMTASGSQGAPGAATSDFTQQVRGLAGQAKRGLVTAVEKIDPGVLADLVIKATALQEAANGALREKGSTYRIAEITVTATIPPQIGFSIARIGDEPEEETTGPMLSSSELAPEVESVEEVVTLEGEVIEPGLAHGTPG